MSLTRSRLLRAAILLAATGGWAAALPNAPMKAAQAPQLPPAPQATSRTVFDRYCISCHNDRLKSGELSLAGVNPADAAAHGAILEKVARKLRGGTMPPEGSRRPDKATMEAFIASLESSLDREAAARPNPGRVASRRLNRAEYVNVVNDLLGLEVNGAELLPSDMAGFGFDNNADVLSITPSLMSRYIAAATKISRLAVGSPDNRPVTQVYKVGFEDRGSRSSEDLPFATRGGIAVRHPFPLDGEYQFKLRLKRNGTVSTIDGIEEDEHVIEVRVDHALVKTFTIGGKFKGRNPGAADRRARGRQGRPAHSRVPHERRRGARAAPPGEGRHAAGDGGVQRRGAVAREPVPRTRPRRSRRCRGQRTRRRHALRLRSVQRHRPHRDGEPSAHLHLPADPLSARRRRGDVRAADRHGPRAPRLPSSGDRC